MTNEVCTSIFLHIGILARARAIKWIFPFPMLWLQRGSCSGHRNIHLNICQYVNLMGEWEQSSYAGGLDLLGSQLRVPDRFTGVPGEHHTNSLFPSVSLPLMFSAHTILPISMDSLATCVWSLPQVPTYFSLFVCSYIIGLVSGVLPWSFVWKFLFFRNELTNVTSTAARLDW